LGYLGNGYLLAGPEIGRRKGNTWAAKGLVNNGAAAMMFRIREFKKLSSR
jgi:hypothetical protein